MSMAKRTLNHALCFALASVFVGGLGCSKQSSSEGALEPASSTQAITAIDQVSDDMSPETVAQGRQVFRFDTFGDEQFWTDKLKMHTVVATGVSPKTALSVGLKVDAEAIPPEVAQAIKDGKVDLDSPATR
jgi:hypothetical protein